MATNISVKTLLGYLPDSFASVASVPLDNWLQHSELQLFYRYVIDNQGFTVRLFAFASWRAGHSARMQKNITNNLRVVREECNFDRKYAMSCFSTS